MNNGLETIVAATKKWWPKELIKQGAVNTRLIWIGLLGVILLAVGGVMDIQSSNKRLDATPDTVRSAPQAPSRSYEEALEGKLANLLSQVKGAGAVTVSITLESSGVQEHEKNIVRETKTVQEKDTSGGVRTTTETKESEQVLLSKENGVDRPVMVREYKPVIKGVMVIAEGAYDSTVKANLTKAVEAGLGVPSYKITVLPQRK